MTVMEFFGCFLVAFGPATVMVMFTVFRYPVRLIVLAGSSCFWILSSIFTGLLWRILQLKDHLLLSVVIAVFSQELFRILKYKMFLNIRGFKKSVGKLVLPYVAGLGYGLSSGVFAYSNILATSIGPGTIGLAGDSDGLFIKAAIITSCIIYLHIFWSVIMFSCLDRKNYSGVLGVFVYHLTVSSVTLLNQNVLFPIKVIFITLVIIISACTAFFHAGGSYKKLKQSLGSSSQTT